MENRDSYRSVPAGVHAGGVDNGLAEGGSPTFPVFRTSEISRAIIDVIYTDLHPGDITLTNGSIFRDFAGIQTTGNEEPSLTDETTGPLRTPEHAMHE